MFETIHSIANEHPKTPAEVIRMGKSNFEYKLNYYYSLTTCYRKFSSFVCIAVSIKNHQVRSIQEGCKTKIQ